MGMNNGDAFMSVRQGPCASENVHLQQLKFDNKKSCNFNTHIYPDSSR